MHVFTATFLILLVRFTMTSIIDGGQKNQEVKSQFMQKNNEDVVHEETPKNYLRRELMPENPKRKAFKDCGKVVRVPFYTDNEVFNAGFEVTDVGYDVDDVDVFSQNDDSVVGFLTLVATIFGERDSSNRGTEGCYEDGYVSITDPHDPTDIVGTVYYAGAGGFQEDFPITGGTGAFARATGIMERQGNTPDFSRFFFELFICLPKRK